MRYPVCPSQIWQNTGTGEMLFVVGIDNAGNDVHDLISPPMVRFMAYGKGKMFSMSVKNWHLGPFKFFTDLRRMRKDNPLRNRRTK